MKRLLLIVAHIFMLLYGGFYAYIGFMDMLDAAAGSQRLLGFIVGFAGSCLAIAAAALFTMHRRSARAPYAVMGLLIGVAPGALMMTNQVLSSSTGGSTAAWLASAAVPCLRASVLVRHGFRPAGGRAANALLSAAVVAAAVQVAIPSMYVSVRKGDAFNIEARIKPSALEPLALTNARGSTATPMRSFEVSVTMTNSGDANLVMLAGAYAVRHEAPAWVADQDTRDGWYGSSRARSSLEQNRWVAASEQAVDADLVETGVDLVNRGDTLSPGGTWLANWITYLPATTSGRLVLDVAIATARQEALDVTLDEKSRTDWVDTTGDGGTLVWSTLPVTETSRVNRWCREDRRVWVESLLPPRVSNTSLDPETRALNITAYMDVNRREDVAPRNLAWSNATREALSRLYGIRKFDDQYELDLWRPDADPDSDRQSGETPDPAGK